MSADYDVIVLGAGPAGTAAALRAAELGARTALIDRSRTGGTCTNTGCVPTRVLAIAARLLRDARSASAYGIDLPPPRIDWPRLVARVREVVTAVNASKRVPERIARAGGDLLLEGDATFVDARTIRLSTSGRTLSAPRIILAVGGKPRRPDIPGVDLALFPSDLMDLPAPPPSIIIVGSGYTGVQVATILHAFGCRVTLLEAAPSILPGADADVSSTLASAFTRQGIDCVTGISSLDSIATSPTGRRLAFTASGRRQIREAAAVLLCVGWPAALDGLGLDAIGLSPERGFIPVDDHLRTRLPHIFCVGDANGRDMLVQGAEFEGAHAADNAVGPSPSAYPRLLLPGGGFTDPDHAGVGLTEAQARSLHLGLRVARVRHEELDRAIIDGRTTGFLKLLGDPATGRILGAHACGEQAIELIQAATIAMSTGTPASAIAAVRMSYPTYAALLAEAARRLS